MALSQRIKRLGGIFLMSLGMALAMSSTATQTVYGASPQTVGYAPSSKVVTVAKTNQTLAAPTISNVNAKVYVDGKQVTLSAPVKMDKKAGKTYLPFRALGDTLGKQVDWNQEYKVAAISDVNTLLEVPLNRGKAVVDGSEVVNIGGGACGFAINGVTYLPIRFVPEQFGYEVTYFGGTNPEIHLTSPGKTKPTAPVTPQNKPTTGSTTTPDTSVKDMYDKDGDGKVDDDANLGWRPGTSDGSADAGGATDVLKKPRK